jgi:formylglycine-generating enzyme required for sulfatase activity
MKSEPGPLPEASFSEADAGTRARRSAAAFAARWWRLAVLLLIIAYFVQIHQVMRVRPDHAFLSLLVLALVLKNAKAFLRDWSPFIASWVAYDLMRGIADDLAPRVHISGPYQLELKMFGPLFGGQIPSFWFLDWQSRIDGTALKHVLDGLASTCYALHMAAPLLLAWVLWHTVKDRPMFYRFVIAFTVTTWAAYATYLLYPAAPPWYVRDYGFVQPDAAFRGAGAGTMAAFDKDLGFPLFESVYKHLNPNKFAAVPSLHAAFPTLILYFSLRRFGRKAWPVALFPAGVFFSAVYLNHHYIIDLLLAILYVAGAVWLQERVLFPLLVEKRNPLRRAPRLFAVLSLATVFLCAQAAQARAGGVWVAETIEVQAGSFVMGEAGTAAPEHSVTLSHAFLLDRDEVTNAAYRDGLQWALAQGLISVDVGTGLVLDSASGEVLVGLDDGAGENACWIAYSSGTFSVIAGKEDWPVVFVTWWGAASYCDWRSGMEGREPAYDHSSWSCGPGGVPYLASGYRLPTEAEWEFASQHDDERRWPWGAQKPDASLANFRLVLGHPAPVGSFPSGQSALGFRDLAGNVWEWVNDWWTLYDPAAATDPAGPVGGSYRSIRGGGWLHDARLLRCASRGNADPGDRNAGLGFRCARKAGEVPVRRSTWGAIKAGHR